MLLELTVLRVAWTFNFDFAHYLLAGVIWMIGWCMVLMSAIVFLPHAAIAVGSVAILLGHNLADLFPAALGALRQGSGAWLWKILYLGGGMQLGENGPPLVILFVIIPWIAVMAAGYAFGPVMSASAERRRSVCMRLGLAMIAAFILLRGLDVYGDPRPWRRVARPPNRVAQSPATPSTATPAQAQAARPPAAAPRPQMPKPLAFLNTAKYPASLSFLLMTLGPMFVLLALVESAKGRVAHVLETFGRVPFFYYLLHIPLIHLAACVVSLIREGSVNPWLFANHPMMNRAGARWVHVELAVAVSRVCDRRGGAVRAVPVVCSRSGGKWQRGAAVLLRVVSVIPSERLCENVVDKRRSHGD